MVQATDVDFRSNIAGDRGGALMADGGGVLTTDGGLWDGNTSGRYAAGMYLASRGCTALSLKYLSPPQEKGMGGFGFVPSPTILSPRGICVMNARR